MKVAQSPMLPQDCLRNKQIYWYDFTSNYQEVIPPQANVVIFMNICLEIQRTTFKEHLINICDYFDCCEILLKIPNSSFFLLRGSEAWHPKIYVAQDWPHHKFSYVHLKIG